MYVRREISFSSLVDRYPQRSMELNEGTPSLMNQQHDELGGSRSSGLKRLSSYGPLSEDSYEKRMRFDENKPRDNFSRYDDKGHSHFSQTSLPDNYKESVGDYDRRYDYSRSYNYRDSTIINCRIREECVQQSSFPDSDSYKSFTSDFHPGHESYKVSRERDDFYQVRNVIQRENYEAPRGEYFVRSNYYSGSEMPDRHRNIRGTSYSRPVTHTRSGNDKQFQRDEPQIDEALGRGNWPGPNMLYGRDERSRINEGLGRDDWPGRIRARERYDSTEFVSDLRRDACPRIVRSFSEDVMPDAFERDCGQGIERSDGRLGVNRGLERGLRPGNDEFFIGDGVSSFVQGLGRDCTLGSYNVQETNCRVDEYENVRRASECNTSLEKYGGRYDNDFVGRDSRPGNSKDLRKDYKPGCGRDVRSNSRSGRGRGFRGADFIHSDVITGSGANKSFDRDDHTTFTERSGSVTQINITRDYQSGRLAPGSEETRTFPCYNLSKGNENLLGKTAQLKDGNICSQDAARGSVSYSSNGNLKKVDVINCSDLNNGTGGTAQLIPYHDSIKEEFILQPSNIQKNTNDILKPHKVKQEVQVKIESEGGEKSFGNSSLGSNSKQKDCDPVLSSSSEKTTLANNVEGGIADNCQPTKHKQTVTSFRDGLTVSKIQDIDGPCGKNMLILFKNSATPIQNLKLNKTQMKMDYVFTINMDRAINRWVCKVFIKCREIACDYGISKMKAKTAAAKAAIQSLRKTYCTLHIKRGYNDDGKMVDVTGRIVPIDLNSVIERLRDKTVWCVNLADLEKVKNTINGYIISDSVHDLVFSPEFKKKDTELLEAYGKHRNLNVETFTVAKKKFLVMSKKLNNWKIVKGLINKDVQYLNKYQLFMPGEKIK